MLSPGTVQVEFKGTILKSICTEQKGLVSWQPQSSGAPLCLRSASRTHFSPQPQLCSPTDIFFTPHPPRQLFAALRNRRFSQLVRGGTAKSVSLAGNDVWAAGAPGGAPIRRPGSRGFEASDSCGCHSIAAVGAPSVGVVREQYAQHSRAESLRKAAGDQRDSPAAPWAGQHAYENIQTGPGGRWWG